MPERSLDELLRPYARGREPQPDPEPEPEQEPVATEERPGLLERAGRTLMLETPTGALTTGLMTRRKGLAGEAAREWVGEQYRQAEEFPAETLPEKLTEGAAAFADPIGLSAAGAGPAALVGRQGLKSLMQKKLAERMLTRESLEAAGESTLAHNIGTQLLKRTPGAVQSGGTLGIFGAEADVAQQFAESGAMGEDLSDVYDASRTAERAFHDFVGGAGAGYAALPGVAGWFSSPAGFLYAQKLVAEGKNPIQAFQETLEQYPETFAMFRAISASHAVAGFGKRIAIKGASRVDPRPLRDLDLSEMNLAPEARAMEGAADQPLTTPPGRRAEMDELKDQDRRQAARAQFREDPTSHYERLLGERLPQGQEREPYTMLDWMDVLAGKEAEAGREQEARSAYRQDPTENWATLTGERPGVIAEMEPPDFAEWASQDNTPRIPGRGLGPSRPIGPRGEGQFVGEVRPKAEAAPESIEIDGVTYSPGDYVQEISTPGRKGSGAGYTVDRIVNGQVVLRREGGPKGKNLLFRFNPNRHRKIDRPAGGPPDEPPPPPGGGPPPPPPPPGGGPPGGGGGPPGGGPPRAPTARPRPQAEEEFGEVDFDPRVEASRDNIVGSLERLRDLGAGRHEKFNAERGDEDSVMEIPHHVMKDKAKRGEVMALVSSMSSSKPRVTKMRGKLAPYKIAYTAIDRDFTHQYIDVLSSRDLADEGVPEGGAPLGEGGSPPPRGRGPDLDKFLKKAEEERSGDFDRIIDKLVDETPEQRREAEIGDRRKAKVPREEGQEDRRLEHDPADVAYGEKFVRLSGPKEAARRLGHIEWRIRVERDEGTHPDLVRSMAGEAEGIRRGLGAGKGAPKPPEDVRMEEPPEAEPEAYDVPTVFPRGRRTGVVTGEGREVPVQYGIVGLDQPVSSHTADLRPDPRFRKGLQPRERDRAASRAQLERMIGPKFDPELLGSNRLASTGAPIIGKDFQVEVGNLRTSALREMRDRAEAGDKVAIKNWDRYREFLRENAEALGFHPSDVAKEKYPMLVRVRDKDMSDKEREKFAQEANVESVARPGAKEEAKQDATRMSDELLEKLKPGEDGDLNVVQNTPFIREFMRDVVPEAQHGDFLDAKGGTSSSGISRMRNAIFAKVYGDSEALSRLAESPSENVRNITKAMTLAAPALARAKAKHPDMDISREIVDAADRMSAAKRGGISSKEAHKQGDLMDKATPLTEALVELMGEHTRSSKRLADILQRYAERVQNIRDESAAVGDMFGEAPKKPSRIDLIRESAGEFGPELFDHAKAAAPKVKKVPRLGKGRRKQPPPPDSSKKEGEEGDDFGPGTLGAAAAKRGQTKEALLEKMRRQFPEHYRKDIHDKLDKVQIEDELRDFHQLAYRRTGRWIETNTMEQLEKARMMEGMGEAYYDRDAQGYVRGERPSSAAQAVEALEDIPKNVPLPTRIRKRTMREKIVRAVMRQMPAEMHDNVRVEEGVTDQGFFAFALSSPSRYNRKGIDKTGAVEGIQKLGSEAIDGIKEDMNNYGHVLADAFGNMKVARRLEVAQLLDRKLQGEELARYPKDIQRAYIGARQVTRELGLRLKELGKLPENFPEERLLRYFPHIFRGQWLLLHEGKFGRDALVNEEGVTPIVADLHEAYTQAHNYMKKHPGAKLRIRRKALIPREAAMLLPRKRFFAEARALEKVLKDTGIELTQADVAAAMKDRGIVIKAEGKFFENVMKREMNLKGYEADPLRALEVYVAGAVRTIHLDPFLRQSSVLMERIDKSQTTLRYNMEHYRNAVGGRYTIGSKLVDNTLHALPWGTKPFALDRLLSRVAHGGYIRLKDTEIPYPGVTQLVLGYNPLSALTNQTQLFLNTIPKLKHKQAAIQWAMANYRSERGRAILREAKIELVDPKYLSGDLLPDPLHSRKFKNVEFIGPLYMFNSVESVNRGGALLLNYGDALAMKMNHADAMAHAKKAMYQQHFRYDISDLPYIFRGPVGKFFFQYKPYMIKQIEYTMDLRGQEWGWYGLGIAALAGMTGIPFLDDQEWFRRVRVNHPEFGFGGIAALTGYGITSASMGGDFIPIPTLASRESLVEGLGGPSINKIYDVAEGMQYAIRTYGDLAFDPKFLWRSKDKKIVKMRQAGNFSSFQRALDAYKSYYGISPKGSLERWAKGEPQPKPRKLTEVKSASGKVGFPTTGWEAFWRGFGVRSVKQLQLEDIAGVVGKQEANLKKERSDFIAQALEAERNGDRATVREILTAAYKRGHRVTTKELNTARKASEKFRTQRLYERVRKDRRDKYTPLLRKEAELIREIRTEQEAP